MGYLIFCRSSVETKLPENSNVIIFKKKDLDRLKAAARIKTFEDKLKEIAQKELIQRRKHEECEHRIKEMLAIDEGKLRKTNGCKEVTVVHIIKKMRKREDFNF
jgi:hypothetical protein